jgi:hypothetical protein
VLSQNDLWKKLLVHYKEQAALVEGPLNNLKPTFMQLSRPSKVRPRFPPDESFRQATGRTSRSLLSAPLQYGACRKLTHSMLGGVAASHSVAPVATVVRQGLLCRAAHTARINEGLGCWHQKSWKYSGRALTVAASVRGGAMLSRCLTRSPLQSEGLQAAVLGQQRQTRARLHPVERRPALALQHPRSPPTCQSKNPSRCLLRSHFMPSPRRVSPVASPPPLSTHPGCIPPAFLKRACGLHCSCAHSSSVCPGLLGVFLFQAYRIFGY